jgi:hypothetical protein
MNYIEKMLRDEIELCGGRVGIRMERLLDQCLAAASAEGFEEGLRACRVCHEPEGKPHKMSCRPGERSSARDHEAYQQGRRAGLEEAAQTVDRVTGYGPREETALHCAACRIRALATSDGAGKVEHVHKWERISGVSFWCPCGAERGT